MSAVLFFAGLFFAASGVASPPLALLAGLIFGFTVAHPFPQQGKRLAKLLLQGSVVALGFGMNLSEVARAGRSAFVYTAAGIAFAMAAGLALGRLMGVLRRPAFLISTGTAICGGSAIAAVGPIVGASEEEMAVSLGSVFVLNSVALFLFPPIGHLFGLSETQFGLWSALAIHDTSSVVGATARYGATALAVGTTTKLARALWIVPLAAATAVVTKRKARIQWPWFVLLFVVASVLNSFLPRWHDAFGLLNQAGRLGLTATLFLIGSGLSRSTLREVGPRPFLQGAALWILVGTTTLALILAGWIRS